MPEISPEDSQLREIKELERQLAKRKAALGLDHMSDDISDHNDDQDLDYTPGWTEKGRGVGLETGPRHENQIESMVATVKTATGGSLAPVDEDRSAEINRDVDALSAMEEEKKIKTLSALAWQKGISYSIEVARRLEDPYTLDLLHSQLSNELHDQLVEAKKLDEV